MTDLLDYRGRISRFVVAILICTPTSVLGVYGFKELLDVHDRSAAGGWFVIFGVPFVFVLIMFGVLELLARVSVRQARTPLPRARVIRR